jgi:Acetylornithine deacetylase/Succinyl-diaminopimelate desuccinylase and related deacylases
VFEERALLRRVAGLHRAARRVVLEVHQRREAVLGHASSGLGARSAAMLACGGRGGNAPAAKDAGMTTDPESGTLALCRELVRIESPSGDEGGVAAAVARAMTALGYDEVRVDELGSVLGIRHGATTGGSAGGALLVDAHMDVVPATEPATWRFPPFAAERREGRIWGRGTTDVKGSLAAAVVGIGLLPRAESSPAW